MSDPHLIGPPPVSTPAELKRSHGRARGLPDDLLRAASLRLGVMSLLFAVLWVVGVTGGHIAAHAIYPESQRWRQFDITDAIALVSVILSLALYVYIRKGERDPKFLLDLGLWYMVYTAFALAFMFHLGGVPTSQTVLPEISWIGAVVLMFAAIVPSTPRKMLIAGLITASMNPILMLVSRAEGVWNFGPWNRVLLMHYPDYILVGAGKAVVDGEWLRWTGRRAPRRIGSSPQPRSFSNAGPTLFRSPRRDAGAAGRPHGAAGKPGRGRLSRQRA